MIVSLGKLQIRFYISLLEKRTGVCSQQFDNPDKHILLWDFDYASLTDIVLSLVAVQLQYHLPNIYIVQSSPDSYHAYCFASRTFREVVEILAATTTIDITYLRLGMVRGYYTLRITSRKNEPNLKTVEVLESSFINEVNPLDVTINEYLTSNKGGKHK